MTEIQNKLYAYIEMYGLHDARTVAVSEELDEIVLNEQKHINDKYKFKKALVECVTVTISVAIVFGSLLKLALIVWK